MNSTRNNTKYIIIHQTITDSIVKDLATMIMFIGLMTFNHMSLGGSTIIDVLFIFLVLTFLSSKNNYAFEGTKDEAIKYLKGVEK